MNARKLTIALLVLAACSSSAENAGIVLNIDTDLTADRTAISRIVVTVDNKQQEWTLQKPLPGSLGIDTSPGRKSVTVEGFVATVLRGRWSGVIVANKGSVVVHDVHLASVGAAPTDAGADVRDANPDIMADTRDAGRDTSDAKDSSLDHRDGSFGEVSGTGGMAGRGGSGGRITLPPLVDGSAGAGGSAGTGGVTGGGSTGRDAGDVATAPDGADGPLPPSDGPPAIVRIYTGAFTVSSQFECLATAAAPGPVGDTLELVHRFVDAPGAAILGFAEDAGVPGLATLRSALPDMLENRLTGWMDSYIRSATAGGVIPFDELTWLDDTVRSLLLYWGLQSKLAIPAGTLGTHAPLTLTFASTSGSPYAIPLDPTAPVTTGIGVSAVVAWPNGASVPAVMTISDHFMGLPFGRYVLQALNAILLAEAGAPNVAKFLSNAVGCPGMAAFVASQCVDVYVSDLCVGHGDDILAVCEGGLGEGARQIENQILSLDLKAIHLQQGIATAIGAEVARPQNATALQDGVWSATVDFGNGEQPANATFSAVASAQ